MLSERIDKTVRNIPDFPKPGIQFKDITPLLTDPELFELIIADFASKCSQLAEINGVTIDRIMGIESRGFIFGAPLAVALGVPFVLARKPNKLPYEHISQEYELEYGTATLQLHTDAIEQGDTVVIVDDLLATGGTAERRNTLSGLVVLLACAFVIGSLLQSQRLNSIASTLSLSWCIELTDPVSGQAQWIFS